jgi:hypothetical protein
MRHALKPLFRNIKLQHPVALCRSDVTFSFSRRLCATSINILSSFSLYCHHYMFRRNRRTSSGVQVVVMKETAARCNAVLLSLRNFLELILGYVGCHARVCLICDM